VNDVRQGKYLEIELVEEDPETARAVVTDMCRQLLANTVIEDYAIDVGD
jgi:phosphoribosylformylglycinamidine synthase PurS subunit